MRLDPQNDGEVSLVLDRVIPPVEESEDTAYVRHVRIRSDRLSEFWGRDMHLGAHVLPPHGFDEHPQARYPLMVFHGQDKMTGAIDPEVAAAWKEYDLRHVLKTNWSTRGPQLAGKIHLYVAPPILERIEESGPAGADLASWRY